jgi:hypothetical protein
MTKAMTLGSMINFQVENKHETKLLRITQKANKIIQI